MTVSWIFLNVKTRLMRQDLERGREKLSKTRPGEPQERSEREIFNFV
jgi:hypothetical protein